MPNWKKVIISGSDASLNSLLVTDNIELTGSLNVSGSTTQIGNNTLLGNTTLSGSIIISGSEDTANPTVRIYGNTQHDGVIRFDPVNTNIDNSISASYIYVSGSTDDLYFSQNGRGYSNTTRLRWLEGNINTGILYGGIVSGTPGSTTFNVAAGEGLITTMNAFTASEGPNPIINKVEWDAFTSQTITNLAVADTTWLLIDGNGNLIQQTSSPTELQFRENIQVGVVLHPNRTNITLVKSFTQPSYAATQQLFTFVRSFGGIKISGHTISANGTNLSLDRSAGTTFAIGRNYAFDPDNPSLMSDAASSAPGIFRYYASGSGFATTTGTTVIDPDNYNTPSTPTGLSSMDPNKFQIQRIFFFPKSPDTLGVYYGRQQYGTIAQALQNLPFEEFEENDNTRNQAVFLGYLIVESGATDLTDTDEARFIQAGAFRTTGAGGAASAPVVTNLEDLNDVTISSVATGDLLYWAGAEWQNTNILDGITITGSFQGDLEGNADTATSSSYAATASSGVDGFTVHGDLDVDGNITGSDITIDDWGSVSASLATTVNTSGTPVNNQLAIFTDSNTIEGDSNLTWDGSIFTINGTGSVDLLQVDDKLQGNGSGFQFFAFNEDTVKVKFANWYSSNDRQYGMGQLWFETWFAAIDNQVSRDARRIGFYLEEPDAGSTDSGTPGQHPTNARFYVDITGSYVASGGLHVTDADFNVESNGNVEVNGSLTVKNSSTGFLLKDSSGTSTYVNFSPQGGLYINPGGAGNSISASSDITTHGDIIGESTHIKLIGPDGGGGSFTYLSSSGDPAAGGFKLSLGDIDGIGNTTTITINDNTEQILLSKALSVTGNITVTGTVDGVDIASLESSVQANDAKIVSLTAATSSYLTSSPFTAAGISGSFNSVSASLAANIPTNNNQLINGAGYTTNTGTVDTSGTPVANDFAKFTDANTIEGRSYSEVKTDLSLNNVENTALSTYTGNGGALDNQYITNGAGYTTNTGTVTSVGGTGTVSGLSLSGTVTSTGNLTLGGTISISSTNITDVDAFSQTGTYASLRAQGTTAADVGLGNVTNESKATMFTSPTFTGTVAIPGFADVSASLAAAVAGGDNLGNHTATQDLNISNNAIINVASITGSDSAAIEITSYPIGYEQLASFPITGSGLVIRETGLPANNYPMLKIGDVEMVDINSVVSPNVFLIHNVDSFLVASGSEPVNLFGDGPNKLFEHTGDDFKIYTKGIDAAKMTVTSASVLISDADLQVAGRLFNVASETTIEYIAGYTAVPNPSPTNELYVQSVSSVIANTNRIFNTGSSALASDGGALGDVVKFGGTTTTAGGLYYLNSSGGWTLAQANAGGTSTGSLAVALGTNSTTDGMLLRGFVNPSSLSDAGIGAPVYVASASAGRFSGLPSQQTGEIVRVVGHAYGTDLVYFHPSNNWIEIA